MEVQVELTDRTRPPLGQMLVAKGVISEEQLIRALRVQEASGRPLGEALVELGILSATALADALLLQHAWRPLGRMLVDRGFLDDEQLDDALREQERTGRPLGEIVRTRYFLSASEIGDVLAEQRELELEMDRGFGTGLRAGIDRRHRGAAGEDTPAAPDEPVLGKRIATREAERDRLAVLQAALEERDEAIAALSSANHRRGEEIAALRSKVEELEQRLSEVGATGSDPYRP
jgi:hypothetical protein